MSVDLPMPELLDIPTISVGEFLHGDSSLGHVCRFGILLFLTEDVPFGTVDAIDIRKAPRDICAGARGCIQSAEA